MEPSSIHSNSTLARVWSSTDDRARCTVVVALNKYELHSFSVDRFRLQERCPQIVGFVETDAFSGRGIAALREKRKPKFGG